MARRATPLNPFFDGRWFDDEIIILCLRWSFRYKPSYRDLVEVMGERGLPVAHTTILRWAVRYAEEFEKRWRRYERPVGGSWRADETYFKVRGRWVYLYRAVDAKGKTVDFYCICFSGSEGRKHWALREDWTKVALWFRVWFVSQVAPPHSAD